MLTCSQCQTLLLDRQYGLLGPDDESAIAAHMADCPACQAEQLKVERFQRLLSSAARNEFPAVRFVAPAAGEVTPAGPSHSRSPRRWVGWFVAAAVLAAVGIPVGSHFATAHRQQQDLAAAQQQFDSLNRQFASLTNERTARLTEAGAAVDAANGRLGAAEVKLNEQIQATFTDLRQKQINVVITGPKTLQAGAPNEYLIETINASGQPAPATLAVQLKDQKDQVVFEEKALRSAGSVNVKLPADLPLTPGRDLRLDLVAQAETGPRAELHESLHLAGATYMTHLTTDKPLYQPGETVYFRSLTLDRASLKPAAEPLHIQFTVRDPMGVEAPVVMGNGQVNQPNGQALKLPDDKPVEGVGAGQWTIPPTAAGGEYAMVVRDLTGRFPEELRKFLVNRYQPARLNKELEWSRKSYGPGDLVVANCKVTRAEGGPVANQPVQATAFVDGQPVAVTPPGSTDAQGTIRIKLALPQQIERGVASLAVSFFDGGSQETLIKPIPIVLNKLLIDFYPEGGDLIAGVPNRVYFQVRTTLGKPADLHGHIVDSTGQIVADVETLTDEIEPGINQGLGRFEFTPEVRQTYKLVIDRPVNIVGEHKLPEVKVEGVVLNTGDGVSGGSDPLRVRVHNAGVARALLVGAYARGRLLDHRRVSVPANGSVDVELKPEAGVGGVTRVTVFEEIPLTPNPSPTEGRGEQTGQRALKPVAERLIYRKPASKLTLTAKPDKEKYAPGDKVNLKLSAVNEKGEPVPAVSYVGVVNQSVVTMADEKTLRSLPTHFLLTSEVQRPEELEHADVLLGDHAKAGAALDLLLGTQGWRRFAEQKMPRWVDPALVQQAIDALSGDSRPGSLGFRSAPGGFQGAAKAAEPIVNRAAENDRILFAVGQPRDLLKTDAFEMSAAKLVAAVRPEISAAQKQLGQALQAQTAVQADPHYAEEAQRLSAEAQQARSAVEQAQATLATTDEARQRTLGWLLPPALGLFLIVAMVALVIGLWRGIRYQFAAAGALGMAAAIGLMLALHVGEVGVEKQMAARAPRPKSAANADREGMAEDKIEQLRADKAQQLYAPMLRDQNGKVIAGQFAKPVQIMPNNFPLNSPPPQAAAPAAPGQAGGNLMAPRRPITFGPLPEIGSGVIVAQNPDDLKAVQEITEHLRKLQAQGVPAQPASGAANGGNNAMVVSPPAGNRDASHMPTPVASANSSPSGTLGSFARVGTASAGQNPLVPPYFVNPYTGQAGQAAAAPLAGGAGINGGMGGGFGGGGGGLGGGGGGGRGGRGGAGGFGGFGGRAMPMISPLQGGFGGEMSQFAPFLVREYAHQHTAAPNGDRTDFAETVFWHPVLVLPKGGATVSFDLSDSVTRYRVLTAANTPDGRLGSLTTQIEARKPLSLEPKLPVEITAGDRLDVPLTIANDTDSQRTVTVATATQGLNLIDGSDAQRLTLTPQQRTRRIYRFQPTVPEGKAELAFIARGDRGQALDSFKTTLPIVPEGFPMVGSVSDVIEGSVRHEIVLPETWVAGTLKCQVSAFPSTLAELQKGLEGLLREPGGCFEQTSTTNYPNTLIVEYLKESNQANPDALRRAHELLSHGYAKLTSFEVPENQKREGFEWFGQAPAHEALTAYGLMQFRDMARVSDVDPALLQRTREFLMARRDGKGGFKRNDRALDSFGRAPADVTNAYIVWALTEGGKDDDITRELNALAEQAKTANDPYFLALVANSLLNRDRADEAAAILRKLAAALTKDGCLDGARMSITGSTGRMLQIETTALAVLGWLKAGRAEFLNPARTAVGWIGKQRGGYGGFGSTQSTILALKALIAFTKANKKTAEAGELRLIVGGRTLNMLSFAAGAQDAMTLAIPNADAQLKPGKNEVRVEMTGKNVFPYTLTWSYQTLQPPSAEGCAVRLTTALDKPEMDEGDTTRLNVKLENVSGKGQGMAVAVIGLPAGLKLPDDFKQLRDLTRLRDNSTRPGEIGAFEVRGRELVLYWRDLAPDAKIELSLDLRGHVPGMYRGPASRAYLYYDPDAKCWTAPLAATVKAKN